jgi:YebC/PmpR family DNA-binding regulatory protein
MSGHSKWSTIKRKKGAKDAKRGAIFTRLAKDIALAARDGGGDVNMNAILRLAVKKAKASNMPNDNIDRAIKKGTGDLPGHKYESYIYEGYGPYGVALLMEVFSDNKNRTVPEIRHLLTKYNGKLGASGCVNWMFEKKGIILINKLDLDEENLLEDLVSLGIEDLDDLEDVFEISIEPDDLNKIIGLLEVKNYNVEGNISLIPINSVSISSDKVESILNLITDLEEHDDVQKVHTNISID